MPKFRWTRYFTIIDGAPTSFANGTFPAGIDLTSPNIELETVKKIYEAGIPVVEPTEIGINKFYPHLKVKKASVPVDEPKTKKKAASKK